MPTVRIDDEVYAWLQKMARPFEDTPNSVLRRVARLDEGQAGEEQVVSAPTVRAVAPSGGRGEKTPQGAFRQPILAVLKRLGGKGDRLRILQEVERLMADRLTPYDKSDIKSGTIRWQKSAEFEAFVMREQGLLRPVSETPRGVWALTPLGASAADKA